ncbi:MAG: NAD(P)-dependent oxidoreductase [Nitrososphaerota archaeon]|nr:NAD(P)-dependent oxidoreductase [Nitrososphaerota archaeon]MDG6930574.1 NAD(P)-dependent oxidoreductase [Nitrososphaerota archaeon]MDG6943902.1 NAD(P)-dependent oxidoreductase [Nitrososphaerota archaeon]
MVKLGFIGLGKMGSALAIRAVQSGYNVIGYNRTRAKLEGLRDRMDIAPSISDVCEASDTMIVSVTDDAADEDVTLGNHGISDYVKPNKTILDFSTISPMESKYINEKLKRKGVHRIEVPVVGGPSKALRGELIALVGGEREKYEDLMDLIRAFAHRTFYIGDIGSAQTVKLAFNLLVAGYAEILGEGLTLVKKDGIDPRLLINVLNVSTYKTEFSETKGVKMVAENYDPTFYLKHMKKDLGLLTKVANEYEIYMPVMSALWTAYTGAVDQELGDEDFSAIFEYLKKVNNVKK